MLQGRTSPNAPYQASLEHQMLGARVTNIRLRLNFMFGNVHEFRLLFLQLEQEIAKNDNKCGNSIGRAIDGGCALECQVLVAFGGCVFVEVF